MGMAKGAKIELLANLILSYDLFYAVLKFTLVILIFSETLLFILV